MSHTANTTISRILFVCTGNICRSPTAHALLEQKAQSQGLEVAVDSAGISDEEWRRPMDARSEQELLRRGYAPLRHFARQIQSEDFHRFDHLIGMTRAHCNAMQRQRDAIVRSTPTTALELGRISLMLDHLPAGTTGRDVPDPWYGGSKDFVQVFDLLDSAVDALLAKLHAGEL